MTARTVLAGSLAASLFVSACGRSASTGEVMPGRSRPVLEHDWTHPRDLPVTPSSFERPDDASALVTTAEGLKAFVIAGPEDRVVQIVAVVPFGRTREHPGEAGASELLSSFVTRAIEGRLGDEVIVRLQTEQDIDLMRVTAQTMSDDWLPALTAVVSGLRDVTIDDATVRAYRTGPGFVRPTRNLAGATFRPAVELVRLWGGYPLAPPDPGLSVRPEAVRALAARTIGPSTVVLGIGGGIDRAAVKRTLASLSAGWNAAAKPETPPAVAPSQPGVPPSLETIEEPGFTTWFAIGHPVPAIDPADEATVAVLTDVVGMRLNIAVREIRGLANQVLLQVPATTRSGGLLHVRSGARPESIAPILHYVREELSKIRGADGVPSADELAQVKGGLVLGRWQALLDGARAASATYAVETVRYGSLDRLAGWPEAVERVAAEAVRAAAVKYIQPDRLAAVIIGQVGEARAARHPRWPFALDDVVR